LAAAYLLWSLVEVPCRQLLVQRASALPRPNLASGLALVCVIAIPFGIWSGAPLERLDLSAVKADLVSDTIGNTAVGAASGLENGKLRAGDIAFGDDLL